MGKHAWNIHLTERCLTSERTRKSRSFLNPVRKDVRKFALSIVREIVKTMMLMLMH